MKKILFILTLISVAFIGIACVSAAENGACNAPSDDTSNDMDYQNANKMGSGLDPNFFPNKPLGPLIDPGITIKPWWKNGPTLQ